MAYRYVFGPDTVDPKSADKKTYLEEDWKFYCVNEFELENIIPELAFLDDYTVTKRPSTFKGCDEYVVNYGGEEYEGDTYLSVVVDAEGDDKGKIAVVSEEMSVGFPDVEYFFSYGAKASYDGEMYTPGLDSQVYPNDSYAFPTRTITVDYAGVETSFKTDASVQIAPVSHHGDLGVDGMLFSSSSLFLVREGEEFNKFDFLLNPSTTGTGFDSVPLADGTGKLFWKAKESMEEE